VSGGDEAVDKVVSTVGLWWPDAEEGDIRTAADAWDQLAAALDRARDAGRGGANQALANWRGPAAGQFETYWSGYDRALPQTAQGCRDLAGGLREYADAVERAKEEVYVLAAEIGASVAIGAALAVFTFGTSAAAAGGAVAALRAAAMGIATRLTATVGSIASRAIIGAAFGSVSSVAANLGVAQPLRVEVFDNGGYSLSDAGWAGLMGGATGGVLGGAGGVFGKLRGSGSGGPIPPGTRLDPPGDGPVTFRGRTYWTPEEHEQVRRYVDASERARQEGWLSETGRVSTGGELHRDSNRAAVAERLRAGQDGTPYQGHVGHAPDTTWTGRPDAYEWHDQTRRVNSSLGAQARHYPEGFKPSEFRVGEPRE